MKKTIAVFLTLLLAFTAAFCAPASAQSPAALKLAVASDLHYNLPEETLTWLTDDPVFGYANRRAAMENESGFLIDAFLADCEKQGADYVLLSGDLADNGRSLPEEHYAVRDKLLRFEQRTGIEVFVIDGNHDLGAGSATDIADFKEIYRELGYDHALTVKADDCSYTADLGDSLRLIALDSCDPTKSTEDGMTAAKVRWVLEQAKAAKAAGREPLLMLHHNLLDHMPLQRLFSHNFIVRNHLATAELFADAGIHIALSGHEHCSDAASYRSALLNEITDFATTSLTMYPLSYRLFTFTGDRVQYESVSLDRIDTAALSAAVSGYTARQLGLMEADLDAYAKAYLKKGVEYRLRLGLSAEKSGLTPGTPLYRLLDGLYSRLDAILSLPMAQAIRLAASYSIAVPETPYATGWDLATDFVAAHYAGSEHFSLDSPEVTALLRLASLILKDVSAFATADLFGQGSRFLADDGGLAKAAALAKRVFGGIRPDEIFVAVLVSDLVYGFSNDDDADDNAGEILLAPQKTETLRGKWSAFFDRLLRRFRNLFAILGTLFHR